MSETPEFTVPAVDQIATALSALQSELPTVAKSHTASVKSDKGSYSYTYAGLADVSEAVLPLLSKHGLSFTTLPGPGVLTGMLLHSSGQHLTATLPVNGSTPQAIGSSLTYMRRYLLGCMTGLVTDDDDDGNAAQQAAKRKPAQPKPAAQTQTMSRPSASESKDVSEAQVKMIGALMGRAGLTVREDALKYVADVIGREVGSRNELTAREASRVIDALQQELGEVEPE